MPWSFISGHMAVRPRSSPKSIDRKGQGESRTGTRQGFIVTYYCLAHRLAYTNSPFNFSRVASGDLRSFQG